MATVLYLSVLLAAFFAGVRAVRTRKLPYLTIAMCVVLAACLAAQLYAPDLLTLFERDAFAVRAGEWWRIITALFFQDGWLAGGLSNIFLLFLIGSTAEQLLKRWQWLAIYFLTGIASEFVALAWQPIGAGNSVAVFGLASSIVVYASFRHGAFVSRILGSISALAALLLLIQHDIHGAAFCIGILVSVLIRALASSKESDQFANGIFET